ncbi:uncharacterized protein LOC133525863 [Cydia pomonella]|uniref:uncharacterized protein LOC133525863 n=1 Tax=Cydia pomonella TaxID=82600 RepID=UPI002ADE4F56|nr:uncharacterized protein LOC133525863 [Cydia pomonella]
MLIYFWVLLTVTCNAYVYQRKKASFLGGRVRNREPFSHLGRQGQSGDRPVNLDNTYFCPVPAMEQKGADLLPPEDSLYKHDVARVIHALWNETHVWAPLICTAALVKNSVFLTAARCIATAKVQYTTVVYRGERLPTKAFILPTRASKQMFDDTGLIVTYYPKQFDYFHTFARTFKLRPEDSPSFDWFDDNLRGDSVAVVGYITSDKSPSTHDLYKLSDMHASTTICNKLYPVENNSTDYRVPCIHSCSLEEHRRNDDSCYRYNFGLGHLVIWYKKYSRKHLIGIVTWTCGNRVEDIANRGGLPLPLGIAAITENHLYDDMKCGERIAMDDKEYSPETIHKKSTKYYKDLCKIGTETRAPYPEFVDEYLEEYRDEH